MAIWIAKLTYTEKELAGSEEEEWKSREKKGGQKKRLLVKVKISLLTVFALAVFFHFVRMVNETKMKDMKNVLRQTSPTKLNSHVWLWRVWAKRSRAKCQMPNAKENSYLPSFATNLIWKQHSSKWNRKKKIPIHVKEMKIISYKWMDRTNETKNC